MGRFGTDIVALATIAGAAVVGGIATFALIEASDDHRGHRVFHAPTQHTHDGMRIEIRSNHGDSQVRIRRDRRIEVRRKRRRHRHRHTPIRISPERVRANVMTFAIEEQIEANVEEMRARIEADLARMERDLERSRRHVRDRR